MMKFNLTYLLIPICAVLVILSWNFKSSELVQLQLLLVAIVVYLVLSLAHHVKDKSLTWEIAFEYILLAAILIALVLPKLV